MTATAALRPAEVDQLGAVGWFERSDWLEAAIFLRASGAASGHPGYSSTDVGRGAHVPQRSAVRGDERVWLEADSAPVGLQGIVLALDSLRLELNREAGLGLHRTELQLARYRAGHAHYQRHTDSLRGRAGRRVTAIYYLNDHWLPQHGGCLRLHLPSGAVDLSPRLNRLVVFLSEQVEHEVLASRANRYALTAWWSGSAVC